MKQILKDSLILFAITVVAGILLAFVNELTKQPIAQQQLKQKQEACQEVGLYPVITFQIYRPCVKISLGNTEVVLHNPSSAVHPYYLFRWTFQVCTYAVEAIVLRLLIYHFLIQRVTRNLREFSVIGTMLRLYEPLCIVRTLALLRVRFAGFKKGLRSLYLPVADIG